MGSILRHRVFHSRVPAPAYALPPQDGDDEMGLERLRRAIGRLKSHKEAMRPSPVFGELTPEQWREVHLWHCEHHFSFLLPQECQR